MSIKTDLEAVARSIVAEAEKLEGVARHDLNRLELGVEHVVSVIRDLLNTAQEPAPDPEPEPAPTPEPAPAKPKPGKAEEKAGD